MGSYVTFIEVFFFVKQKTAYEMLRSLVGSEMCIRDSDYVVGHDITGGWLDLQTVLGGILVQGESAQSPLAVSYTHLTLPTIYSV